MSRSIGSRELSFSSLQNRLGICAAVMLVAACSFDAGKLRAPSSRDAAFTVGFDAPGTGEDTHAQQSDVGAVAGDTALATDLAGSSDIGFSAELPGGSGGSDLQDSGNGQDSFDGSGAGGSQGGTGGNDDSGSGGIGGTAVDGETDDLGDRTDTGDVAGDVTHDAGTGGVGGDGGGDTAEGAGDAGEDSGTTDGPVLADVAPDSKSAEVSVPTLDTDLVLWYRFDESNGTTASDSAKWGGAARDATLVPAGPGTATFSTAKQVGSHALLLSTGGPLGNGGGYVTIRGLQTLAPDAITIAVWVSLSGPAPQTWARIFDCADSSTSPNFFNLAVRNGASPYGPIFVISNLGHATTDEQRLISSTVLTANVWHHVAVVLPAGASYKGIMYIDGTVAATNDAMTLHLSDIGATANNWLGRSEFTNDPYFNGSMDDFRVYRRALSQEEIVALMAIR